MERMGSIEIGYGNAIYAKLHASTVAALEITITKCVQDGRSFMLRIYNTDSDQVVSTVVSPGTPIKIGYRKGDTRRDEVDVQATSLLDAIISDGSVVVLISDE